MAWQAQVGLAEPVEMEVTQPAVAYLGLTFVPLGLPAALVAQAALAALAGQVATVATADQSRRSGLEPLRVAMQALEPMAKQARVEPLAPTELQGLRQRPRFLIPSLV